MGRVKLEVSSRDAIFMPDYCTCGTELPPEALFCHKCGKPQREFGPAEKDEAATAIPIAVLAPAVQPGEPPPLDFRNRVAVRTALVVAVSAAILSSFLPFLAWLAAGFFAVFFYRRRTGWLVNVGSGVRLGWLTGLFTFALLAVVLSVEALSGQLATAIQKQVAAMPMTDPAMAQQMTQFLGTGAGLTSVLLFALAALFLFITGLSMAGGALGAKLLRRG